MLHSRAVATPPHLKNNWQLLKTDVTDNWFYATSSYLLQTIHFVTSL
jgi:hypothetical protein